VTLSVPIRIANRTARTQSLVLEPWAHELNLGPGQVYTVIAEGDPSYPMAIDFSEGTITVHCFDSAGAVMSVIAEDGRRLF